VIVLVPFRVPGRDPERREALALSRQRVGQAVGEGSDGAGHDAAQDGGRQTGLREFRLLPAVWHRTRDDASRHYRQAAEAGNTQALEYLAKVLFQAGHAGEALRLLETLIESGNLEDCRRGAAEPTAALRWRGRAQRGAR